MKNLNALIIDDSSVMRKIVERCLRQSGIAIATVYEAANGAEALAILDKSSMDVIFCDINMPIMGGLEFIRRLKDVPKARNVPIVMITTEGGEAHVVEALSSGARGYIRKPFTPEQMRDQVTPLLQGIK